MIEIDIITIFPSRRNHTATFIGNKDKMSHQLALDFNGDHTGYLGKNVLFVSPHSVLYIKEGRVGYIVESYRDNKTVKVSFETENKPLFAPNKSDLLKKII